MEPEAALRTLLKQVGSLEQNLITLRFTVEGDNGRGGLVEMIRAIAANQEADRKILRLSIWMPTIIALVALLISLTTFVLFLIFLFTIS